MTVFFDTLLLCYATLFPIMNPIGNMPLVLSLSGQHSDGERQLLARKVAVNSFFMLLGSLFVGSYVLGFFGISLPAVRIAGGMVVTAFGWRLLHSGQHSDTRAAEAAPKPKPLDSFYPITMPLTVGPGSISVAIALGSQRPGNAEWDKLALIVGASVLALLALSLTVYFCYRFAEGMAARLGTGGMNVVVRLSAFILLCIGVQIMWTGLGGLTIPALHH